MYKGLSEYKRVKGAIKHITNVFCKIIRYKSKDAMSKTLKYKFKYDLDTKNNCTNKVKYFIITLHILAAYFAM